MLFLPLSVKPLNIFEKSTPRTFNFKIHRKTIENPTKIHQQIDQNRSYTRLGSIFERLAASRRVLGAFWRVFGASWARLGGVLARLGASWARLGRVLARLGRVLARLGSVLEASWRVLGASGPIGYPRLNIGHRKIKKVSIFDRCLIDVCSQLRPTETQKGMFFLMKYIAFSKRRLSKITSISDSILMPTCLHVGFQNRRFSEIMAFQEASKI